MRPDHRIYIAEIDAIYIARERYSRRAELVLIASLVFIFAGFMLERFL